MQERHLNRSRYFEELAISSEKYFVPYLLRFTELGSRTRVLEIGCGDGGNLLPFVRRGCQVTGMDISEKRIEDARVFFEDRQLEVNLFAADVFALGRPDKLYDVILVHDVIEHIYEKQQFLEQIWRFAKPGGLIFIGFPAWQMPFGGHQQICRHKIASHIPFVHLLPQSVYRSVLRFFGEDAGCVNELLDIKRCGLTVEYFEKLVGRLPYELIERQLWLINPHYEVKFGLSPRKLNSLLSSLPVFRNFVSSSCFYLLKSVN